MGQKVLGLTFVNPSFHFISHSLSIAAAFLFLLASFSCGIASLLVRPALRLLIGWFDVGGLICLNAGCLYNTLLHQLTSIRTQTQCCFNHFMRECTYFKLWIYGATNEINNGNKFKLLKFVCSSCLGSRHNPRHVRSVRQSNIETTVCIAIKILWSSLVFSNGNISLPCEINAVVTMTLVYVDGDACLV